MHHWCCTTFLLKQLKDKNRSVNKKISLTIDNLLFFYSFVFFLHNTKEKKFQFEPLVKSVIITEKKIMKGKID